MTPSFWVAWMIGTLAGSLVGSAAVVGVILWIQHRAHRKRVRHQVELLKRQLPERPLETYRCGCYFVTAAGLWWLVCKDTDDPSNPDVLDQFALSRSAIREAARLAAKATANP